jgi:N-acylneuraminate cytidylyltransferase
MSANRKIVAFIPVRGGSKSIPLKNIKTIAGKPLVFWTVRAALETDIISKVYVATDSKIISQVVGLHFNSDKLAVVGRDQQTVTDIASSEAALLEFCSNYEFDYVFFIQATSPLLSSRDLEYAWNYYEKGAFDSLLSMVRQKRFFWRVENRGEAFPLNYDPNNRPRRQDFQGVFVENGAFYVSSRKKILSTKCRISGRIGIYQMNENSYYELDEIDDWLIVENILLQRERGWR